MEFNNKFNTKQLCIYYIHFQEDFDRMTLELI